MCVSRLTLCVKQKRCTISGLLCHQSDFIIVEQFSSFVNNEREILLRASGNFEVPSNHLTLLSLFASQFSVDIKVKQFLKAFLILPCFVGSLGNKFNLVKYVT